MSIDRPTALITGASGAIGIAIARRLLRDGWDVALASRDLEELHRVQSELEGSTEGVVSVHRLDLRDHSQGERVVAEVAAAHGRLDGLVNNAGIMIRKTALETTLEEWRSVLDVNLTGALTMAKACFPLLAASGHGAIVSTSSSHSILAARGSVAYSTSKAGLNHLTRLLALEWAAENIRVNAVGPTVVPSRMTEDVLGDPAYVARKFAAIPLGRAIEPAHVAAAVAFFLSKDSGSTTGQTLIIDGGESLA